MLSLSFAINVKLELCGAVPPWQGMTSSKDWPEASQKFDQSAGLTSQHQTHQPRKC